MQSANLTASSCICWTWAWVGGSFALDELDGLDELDELEPQAAITVAAAMAAAAIGRSDVVLDMPHVVPRGTSHECNRRSPRKKRHKAVMAL